MIQKCEIEKYDIMWSSNLDYCINIPSPKILSIDRTKYILHVRSKDNRFLYILFLQVTSKERQRVVSDRTYFYRTSILRELGGCIVYSTVL